MTIDPYGIQRHPIIIQTEHDHGLELIHIYFLLNGEVVLPRLEMPAIKRKSELAPALLKLRESIDVAYAKLVMNLEVK